MDIGLWKCAVMKSLPVTRNPLPISRNMSIRHEARTRARANAELVAICERPRVDMRRAMAGLHSFHCHAGRFQAQDLRLANAGDSLQSGNSCLSRADDFFFGILHSHFHEIWSLAQGTRLETRPRYTPTTCFETFPFPFRDDLALPHPPLMESQQDDPTGWKRTIETRFLTLREEPPPYHFGSAPRELKPAAHRAAIAAAAKELNELREHWLNPPEWTMEKNSGIPRFSIAGPWARYIDAENRGCKDRRRHGALSAP